MRVTARPLGAKVDLHEARGCGCAVLLGVSIQPGLQVGVRWGLHFDKVRVQKLHLLAHPPPDDQVVLVKPEGQRLAVEDLFLDEVLGQSFQFRAGRRAHPGAPKLLGKAGYLLFVDNDPVGPSVLVIVDQIIEPEQARSENKKMKQRFADEPSE
jgi:hypothetical protein